MLATIIDGKKIAEEIKTGLAKEIEQLKNQGIIPGLAAVLVGTNPASEIYVRNKARACQEVGIYSEVIRRPDDLTETELLNLIRDLNRRLDIHGILIQSPLPGQVSEPRVYQEIDPSKDVDGFHPLNIGKMLLGQPTFLPCTPLGVIELLKRSGNHPAGKNIVILGRGNIVGKPLAIMLLQNWSDGNATITVVHTKTSNPFDHIQRADILIVAIGKPEFVTGEMLKRGAVVVDVGINRVADSSQPKGYRVTGDVNFDSARLIASAITPVPGGVGPMTIAMLLANTVKAAIKKAG